MEFGWCRPNRFVLNIVLASFVHKSSSLCALVSSCPVNSRRRRAVTINHTTLGRTRVSLLVMPDHKTGCFCFDYVLYVCMYVCIYLLVELSTSFLPNRHLLQGCQILFYCLCFQPLGMRTNCEIGRLLSRLATKQTSNDVRFFFSFIELYSFKIPLTLSTGFP